MGERVRENDQNAFLCLCTSVSQLIAGDPYAQLNFDSLIAFFLLIKVGVACRVLIIKQTMILKLLFMYILENCCVRFTI